MCGIGSIIGRSIVVPPSVREQLKFSRSATVSQGIARTKASSLKNITKSTQKPTVCPATGAFAPNGSISELSLDGFAGEMLRWIIPRGPDVQRVCRFPRHNTYLMSAVLNLRGHQNSPTSQPILQTEDYSSASPYTLPHALPSSEILSLSSPAHPLLSWNGEVFHGALTVLPGENDTLIVYQRLSEACAAALTCISASTTSANVAQIITEAVMSVLDTIQGPFALIYAYPLADGSLAITVARDRIGRRSLLLSLGPDVDDDTTLDAATDNTSHPEDIPSGNSVHASPLEKTALRRVMGLALCSTGVATHLPELTEVLTPGSTTQQSLLSSTVAPVSTEEHSSDIADAAAAEGPVQQPSTPTTAPNALAALPHPLSGAAWYELPCTGVFTILVVPSTPPTNGGDNRSLPVTPTTATAVPTTTSISTFTSTSSSVTVDADAVMSFTSWVDYAQKRANPSSLIVSNTSADAVPDVSPRALHFPYRHPTRTPLSALPPLPHTLLPLLPRLPLPAQHCLRRLAEAVRRHVAAMPAEILLDNAVDALPPSTAAAATYDGADAGDVAAQSDSGALRPAPIAVLYSGGVDCTVLAALLHHYLPARHPVDLVNVAFAGDATPRFVDETVPDRASSILGLGELRRTCATREWRLIKVNITLDMLEQHRAPITALMRPHGTVMDFNIAAVLYFAARGQGILHQDTNVPDVDTTAAPEPSAFAPPVRLAATTALDATPASPLATSAADAAERKAREKAQQVLEKRQRADREREALSVLSKEQRASRKQLMKDASALRFRVRQGTATEEEYAAFLNEKKQELAALRCVVHGYTAPEMAHSEQPENPAPDTPESEATATTTTPADAASGATTACTATQSSSSPDLSEPAPTVYCSAARVLLLGSGADEQLGGYGRHRTAWKIANRVFCDILRAQGALREGEGEGDVSLFGRTDRSAKSVEKEEGEEEELDEAVSLADCSGDEGEDINVATDRLHPPMEAEQAFCSYTASDRPRKWLQRQQRRLRAELNRDVHRLWVRNLGRDDRALSHWGREARHPFLDEDLMVFLCQFKADWKQRYWQTVQSNITFMAQREEAILAALKEHPDVDPGSSTEEDNLIYPLESLCNMNLPAGVGDKLILRQVASALGLDSAGRLMKRAMQFGTKIAKREMVGTATMNDEYVLKDIVNSRYLRDNKTGKCPGELSQKEMLEMKRRQIKANNKQANKDGRLHLGR